MTTDTLFPTITGTNYTREKLEALRQQANSVQQQIREAEIALGLRSDLSRPFTSDDEKFLTETLAAQIYDAYPKKQARGSGLAAIRKAMKKVEALKLLEHVQEYAAATAKWQREDCQFIPMCATWMNQERWLDDRREWQRGKASFEPQIRGL